jgi:hypothetical protein
MELYAAAFALGFVIGWLSRCGQVARLREACDIYQNIIVEPHRGREGAQ